MIDDEVLLESGSAKLAMGEFGADRTSARLHEVARLDLKSTLLRALLDRLCRTAAQRLGAMSAYTALLLDDALYFAGRFGLDRIPEGFEGVPSSWTPCEEVVTKGVMVELGDSPADLARSDRLLLTMCKLDGYVGVPVRIGSEVVGTFALMWAGSHALEPDEHKQVLGYADTARATLLSFLKG